MWHDGGTGNGITHSRETENGLLSEKFNSLGKSSANLNSKVGGRRRDSGSSVRGDDGDTAEEKEVDLVGCVFAITRESSTGTGEAFVSATDSVITPPRIKAGGGDANIQGPRRRELSGLAFEVADDKSRTTGTAFGVTKCADVGAPGASAASNAEHATYHVYLTDPSGACVRLEKEFTTPSLARHHRILRSAPGACLAVVNGSLCPIGSSPPLSLSSSATTKTPFANVNLAAVVTGAHFRGNMSTRSCYRNEPSLGQDEGGRKGARTVTWSSMSAIIGGNGSALPPRFVGGAPTKHLGCRLLELRRWAESSDGRNAVHRERQRLALLLAREKCDSVFSMLPPTSRLQDEHHKINYSIRGGSDGVCASEVAAAAKDGTTGSGSNTISGGKSGDLRHLTFLGQDPEQLFLQQQRAATTVLGFVTHFTLCAAVWPPLQEASRKPQPGFQLRRKEDFGFGVDCKFATPMATPESQTNDGGVLLMHVDTGERILALHLPKIMLRKLLRLALDRHNSLRPPLLASQEPVTVPMAKKHITSSGRAAGDGKVAKLGENSTELSDDNQNNGGGILQTNAGDDAKPGAIKAIDLPTAAMVSAGVVPPAEQHRPVVSSPASSDIASSTTTSTIVVAGTEQRPLAVTMSSPLLTVSTGANRSSGGDYPASTACHYRDDEKSIEVLIEKTFRTIRKCIRSTAAAGSSCYCCADVVATSAMLKKTVSAPADDAALETVRGQDRSAEEMPPEQESENGGGGLMKPSQPPSESVLADCGSRGQEVPIPTESRTAMIPASGRDVMGEGDYHHHHPHYPVAVSGAAAVAPLWCSGEAGLFLAELATACDRSRQYAFTLAPLSSSSRRAGREVGVVNDVRRVDAARSAKALLKDLLVSCPPPLT